MPTSGPNSWREHPDLRGRFHPEAPDDLQVIVHDGGPRLTDHQPELIWVRVTGAEGDVFTGRALNQPQQLTGVAEGSTVRFLLPQGADHPLQVSPRYLAERGDWIIEPCNRCGSNELFDAPSELIRKLFPNQPADAKIAMFTTFCGLCGGVQGVQNRSDDLEDPDSSGRAARRPWWQFWK